MPTSVTPSDAPSARSLAVLRSIFGARFAQGFAVTFWDGTRVDAIGPARFTLAVNTPFALRGALTPPLDLNPGRAFVEKWIDFEGDFEAAIDTLETAVDSLPRFALPRIIAQLMRLPKPPRDDAEIADLRGRRHSKRRDSSAIGFHYDLPVTFYRTFLDRRMIYSCAYWDDGVTNLDDAQLAKLDYTLRKLRLKPGERLLDIGCGWGALVIRAAQTFGAQALGVTLSRRQYEEAQRRIDEAGLGDRARVVLRDYRDLRGERFDKIVSVGMVEHVGRERLGEYFRTAYDALRDGGLFLNHGIAAQNRHGKGYRASGFIQRYVFPDGDLVNVDAMLRNAEAAGFEVRDVENMREHYARTLRAWVANLVARRDAVLAAADERTFRVWQLYMSGSARNFARGQMGLFQSLLAKPGNGVTDIPATRRDLYAADAVRL